MDVSCKYLVAASDDNSVRLYDYVAGSRKTLLNKAAREATKVLHQVAE